MTKAQNLFAQGGASVEDVRFEGERRYAEELNSVIDNLAEIAPPQGERVRRQLMSRSLLLSEGMAPHAYAAARYCAEIFGVTVPIEVFQAAGAENAAMHFCTDPALLEIQGRMLALLDEAGLRAIMGHELGHFLAHGPNNPAGSVALVAQILAYSEGAPDALVQLARRYSMSKEFTADRFGLLASGSLDAALRLGMVAVTGLPVHDLNWDTQAYLNQSKALVEDMLRQGETAQGSSHPEHSLRAWAQWQFSETEVFHRLTGQGPGTRRLAELEAQLIQILGQPDVEFDDAQVFEEPQPEVQECALAACCLVAHADEEFHETETEAIEKVFAHLLPHWRDYLEREYALARFQDLAPMLYSSGPRAQRALFMLLFHVTAADGAVDAQEIAAILSIGDALGCPRLFRQLLTGILGKEPAVEAEVAATSKAIPMAAESLQVERALQVFFRRAAERGGSEVTGRRLLRLTGESRYSNTIREQLTRVAQSEGLRIEPALSEDLDTPHQLINTRKATTEKQAQNALETDEATRRLHQTLSKLRDKLVAGDGRSPSVRLRDIRRGRNFDMHQLEQVSVGLAERVLELIRGEAGVVLVESEHALGHEPSARCERQLIELRREHLSRMEETGADDLFLGTGFIAASVNRYLLRAPLILHNVEIERNAARVRLKPRREQNTVANQALLQTIARLAKKPWSDELAEAADDAAASGLDAMLAFMGEQGYRILGQPGELRALRNRNEEFEVWIDDRVELENCAVLGLFPQSRSDLLHDYDQLLEQLRAGASVSDILAAATHLLPSELKSLVCDDSAPMDSPETQPVLPVIQADPVQREVIALARDERALVVDGPPGTGKSQVIVNLICDALLRGEKVAIVCEKRAALDVVVNRLQGEGLRHLLALVHDVKDDRKALYRQVVERIDDNGTVRHEQPDLATLQNELNSTSAVLCERRQALTQRQCGLSLGQALILSGGIDGIPEKVPGTLAKIDQQAIETLSEHFSNLSRYSRLWAANSVWVGPDARRPRSSFARSGANEQAEIQALLEQGITARQSFETAFQAAALPLENQALKQALVLQPVCRALLSAHEQAREAKQSKTLNALFMLIEREGLESLSAYASALETFEQNLLTAGLEADRKTLQTLAQARPQLTELIPVARQNTSSLGMLNAFLSDWQKLTSSLGHCRKLWSSHADALHAHPQRITWEDSDGFKTALQIVRSQLGRWQRLFSPAWWSARSAFTTHVSLHWPGQTQVAASAPFVAELERYRQAAQCWRSLDELVDLAKIDNPPADPAESRALLEAARASQGHAQALIAAETMLDALGLWPLPSSISAWSAWRERTEAMLKVPPALGTFHQARKRLAEQAPELRLPQQSEKLAQIKPWITNLQAAIKQRPTWQAVKCWPEGNVTTATLAQLTDGATKLQAIERTFASLKETVLANQHYFPWLQISTPLTHWKKMHDALAPDFDALVKADQMLEKCLDIFPDASDLLRQLSRDTTACEQPWDALVTGCWAKTIADQLLSTVACPVATNQLSSELEADDAQRFRQQHQASHAQVSDAVIARQNDSAWFREPPADKGARRTPIQSVKEAMLKEARKQRRLLPMRTFVRRYADQGLLDALPVWLLSPETMAQLFPREAVFDLVIIDEASQCTVETGLPVLMRAKRIVIAGDEHQMPPSNYFKASAVTDDSEGKAIPTDVMDAESLLVLARDRCRHRRIAWHYRCQFEELIAFSNQAIYGGDLRTIPSTQSRSGPCAITWHALEEATYEAGVNENEAEAVVDLMQRLLSEDAGSTIGVVTFNLAQRRAILDAIERRSSKDESFAAVYQRAATDEQLDQRPFVKNLENVQGDERDQIIFSLGHAPKLRRRKDGKDDWYVPARFGPLGQRGGERRLNVAASRAKRAIHLVSSFDPAMLSVANAKNEGPRLFKGFLEFGQLMAKGHRSEAELVLDTLRGRRRNSRLHAPLISTHYVPMKVQLLLALEERGHRVELDIGSSDFRVDVAIANPNEHSLYALGIICDEGSDEFDAFEQHVHIPAVLSLRGWTLTRVNALDWGRQRDLVLKRIEELVS